MRGAAGFISERLSSWFYKKTFCFGSDRTHSLEKNVKFKDKSKEQNLVYLNNHNNISNLVSVSPGEKEKNPEFQ